MMYILSLISTLQNNLGLKLMIYFKNLKTHSQNRSQLKQIIDIMLTKETKSSKGKCDPETFYNHSQCID